MNQEEDANAYLGSSHGDSTKAGRFTVRIPVHQKQSIEDQSTVRIIKGDESNFVLFNTTRL